MTHEKTKDMVSIALCAVLIAVCSWISIPTVIPFTMQTFAVYFTLHFLGAKRGTLAVCLYLLLGVAGIPVYSNFTSGIGILFGIRGGYMTGWILSGFVMALFERLPGRKRWLQACSMLMGLLVCYISGTVWFMIVYARTAKAVGVGTALLWCVVPFIIPDLAKLGLALWLSRRLEKLKHMMLL